MARVPRTRSPRWLLAVVMAGVLLAGACSDPSPPLQRSAEGGDTTASTEDSAPSGESATTTEEEGDSDDESDRTSDGDLRLGLAGSVVIDPIAAAPSSVPDIVAIDLLYDTLTTVDGDGAVAPGLASFSVNPAKDLWTFRLREDVTFADGSPIQAADVVYSLERMIGQGTGSITAQRLEDIDNIRAVGQTQIRVRLKRPSTLLGEALAAPVYGIVQRSTMEALADESEGVLPNGSGSYAVAEVAENRMVLERRGEQGPTRVELSMYGSESEATDAFLQGDVDWTVAPPNRLEEATAAAGAGGLIPFNAVLYLGVDPRVGPLTKPNVRTAIALSVDRAALVDAVYGPAAQPLLGVVPAGVPGSTDDECPRPCGPDRERARDLIAKALPDGQKDPIRLLVSASESMDQVGDTVGEQLAASGLDVEVTAEDPNTYGQLIVSGRQQLFVFSWLGVARSPADYLPPLFETSSPDNLTAYSNKRVDNAIKAARSRDDHEGRAEAWARAEEEVLKSVAVVPLIQFRTTSVTSDRIEGLRLHVDGGLDVSGVTFPA